MKLELFLLNYIKTINKKIRPVTPTGVSDDQNIPFNSGEILNFINLNSGIGIEYTGISGIKILEDISFIPLEKYLYKIYSGIYNQVEPIEYEVDEYNLPKVEKRLIYKNYSDLELKSWLFSSGCASGCLPDLPPPPPTPTPTPSPTPTPTPTPTPSPTPTPPTYDVYLVTRYPCQYMDPLWHACEEPIEDVPIRLAVPFGAEVEIGKFYILDENTNGDSYVFKVTSYVGPDVEWDKLAPFGFDGRIYHDSCENACGFAPPSPAPAVPTPSPVPTPTPGPILPPPLYCECLVIGLPPDWPNYTDTPCDENDITCSQYSKPPGCEGDDLNCYLCSKHCEDVNPGCPQEPEYCECGKEIINLGRYFCDCTMKIRGCAVCKECSSSSSSSE